MQRTKLPHKMSKEEKLALNDLIELAVAILRVNDDERLRNDIELVRSLQNRLGV